ncbi:MAG: neutral/alkaline non-lysosomal ceramidase N-terminal domain-containing protein [Pirellulales bacterium]
MAPLRILCAALVVSFAGSVPVASVADTAAEQRPAQTAAGDYLIGRGSADITGPPVGVKMLGYVRPDQITEGIHLRQFARAFVVAEPGGQHRLAIVTCDLQSVTHSLVLSVLDAVRKRLGDAYRLDNVVIAATHTHAVPGGYWHYAADTPFGSPFHPEHFDALVAGITASIVAAHEDLRPGRILIAEGEVESAGANRSRLAYLNNPEAERQAYRSDTDTHMTLLRFEREGRPIGLLNWHAVHPTSMSFHNKLISSDNKGYAAWRVERARRAAGDDGFVAAFAQSNCGDVTPHLDLTGKGPGEDEFEGTAIIGGRMADAAERIFAAASEPLAGPIDARQSYVDLGRVSVRDEFTHAGPQVTGPPAYGYSFAAGSTEDGGGQPMFREGMTQREPFIDALARTIVPLPPANEAMRQAHRPKPILLALGAADPPAMPQVLPIGVARVGQLALVIGPAEFTTMSGRRFREAVKHALPGVRYVAVAGYANDYAGYVATREEYEVQHYEGAATLFGPWTQAAYAQEFARLAADIAAGRPSDSHAPPHEMRGTVRPTPLSKGIDRKPETAEFGAVTHDAESAYRAGDTVRATFVSGNPNGGYRPERQYAVIESQRDGRWQAVARDGDWDVKCRWLPAPEKGGDKKTAPLAFSVEWTVPADAAGGTYRVGHAGVFRKEAEGPVHEFETYSRPFQVN